MAGSTTGIGGDPALLYDPTRPDPIPVLAHPGPGHDPLDGPPILRMTDLGVIAASTLDPEPGPGTGGLACATYLGMGIKHRRPGVIPPATYRVPVLPRMPELGVRELIDRLAAHAALYGLRTPLRPPTRSPNPTPRPARSRRTHP